MNTGIGASFMRMHILFATLSLSLSTLLVSFPSYSAWFSSTGQAVIINGNKEAARKQATEEAIKQALLFAGASVRSVQQMTNGLLMDDHLEIRSSGEVNSIELLDEVYEGDVVTVSIRADIFAQEAQCSAADYTKQMASTYFPIRFEAQANDGQIQNLGEATALEFRKMLQELTTSMRVSHIEPYVFDWHYSDYQREANALATKTNTQFVISIVLDDISVERFMPNGFNPFKSEQSIRSFDFSLSLLDGASGDELYSKQYQSLAEWGFDYNESVDVASERFWRSQYGLNIEKMLQKSITDLEEFIICQPTMGRVLAVANNQLQINLGKLHKVKAGDLLTLFTVQNIQDTFGQEFQQFKIHPTSLIVQQVYNDTATVTSEDGTLLGDVQANDFVARR